MKYLFSLLLFCCTAGAQVPPMVMQDLLAVASRPGGGTPNVTDGLVAWYQFSDGSGSVAADSSGNGHTAYLTNAPTWTNSNLGGALLFNGTNQWVNAGSLGNVYSISYWIYSPTISSPVLECNPNQYVSDLAVSEGFNSSLYVNGVSKTLYSTNIVPDPGIEAGNVWISNGGSGAAYQTNNPIYSGSYSECLIRTGGGYVGIWKALPALENGATYRAEGWSWLVIGGYYSSLKNSGGSGADLVTWGNGSTNLWGFSYGYATMTSAYASPGICHMNGNSASLLAYFDDDAIYKVLIRYPATNSVWQHVAITSTNAVIASATRIGAALSSYLGGMVQDVRFYNRALSATEVQTIYNWRP